jgi:hypothetical protein
LNLRRFSRPPAPLVPYPRALPGCGTLPSTETQFYEAARAGKTRYVVTGNKGHFPKNKTIKSPKEFIKKYFEHVLAREPAEVYISSMESLKAMEGLEDTCPPLPSHRPVVRSPPTWYNEPSSVLEFT